MTRSRATPTKSATWALQDAKARFSELVRRAKAHGPQLVTIHGTAEVVVLAVEEFRKLTGQPTGQQLVDALQASPLRDVADEAIEQRSERSPIRRVDL